LYLWKLQLTDNQQKFSSSGGSESGYQRSPRVNAELNRLEDAVRRRDEKEAANAAKALQEEADKQAQIARLIAANKKVSLFVKLHVLTSSRTLALVTKLARWLTIWRDLLQNFLPLPEKHLRDLPTELLNKTSKTS
jgi:hypothetical protein